MVRKTRTGRDNVVSLSGGYPGTVYYGLERYPLHRDIARLGRSNMADLPWVGGRYTPLQKKLASCSTNCHQLSGMTGFGWTYYALTNAMPTPESL
jgi:hypothetical protein